MRFQLKEETEDFAEKVMGLVVPKYANHWRDKLRRLWADVQERGFSDKTDSTKKLYMSKFRSAVRSALEEAEKDEKRRQRVESDLMEELRIDPAILSRLQEDYQRNVAAKNTDLILVPEWEWFLKTCRTMLKGDDMMDCAIALMALTGRRFAEVLQSGDFAPCVDTVNKGIVKQRWLVEFSGQLKTKGGADTMAGKTYRIPTLAPAAEIVAAFERLRSSAAGQEWMSASERRLSTTFNPEFNRRLKAGPAARFWPSKAPLTLKELRALYAEIAYASFAPRTTRAPYYARILGHSEDDLNTALSYMRYMLSKDALAEGQEEMNRLTMLREQRREEAIAATSGEQAGDHDDPGDEGSCDLIED